MSPPACEDILFGVTRPLSLSAQQVRPLFNTKRQLMNHPMMDSPSVSSGRRRVRCRNSSTTCVAPGRTENRRRQTPQPVRPMALFLASCIFLLAVEMPAPVSARLHEQSQQDIIQDDYGPVMDAANIIDYDVDIVGGQAQQEAIQAQPDQTQSQPQQDHRRLQEMKSEWPECIGMQAEDCVALIESEAPDAYTLIVRPADYDFHRVIIRVDSDSLVTKTPSRG